MAKKNKICPGCGVLIWQASTHCHDCWAKTRRKHGAPPTCIDCGVVISGKGAKRCRPCNWIHLWGTPTPPTCPDCGTIISKLATRCRPCAAKHNWAKPEVRRRHEVSIKNRWVEKCYLLGRDLSKASYPPEFNGALKQKIRKRDGFSCMVCGDKQNGRALDVHHIDYDKGNNGPLNLVALCVSCHSKTQKNRDYWRLRFQALLSPMQCISPSL